MSLLAALNLQKPKRPATQAPAKPEDDADLARLKAVVGEKMKTAVQLVSGVADPKRKVELAQALESAEKQRLAAAKLIDAAARVAAMQQVEVRIQKTIDAVLPRDVQDRHDASLAREVAKALQPKLDADRKAAVEACGMASKAAEEADTAAKAAKGDAKKAADMRKAAADKQLAAAQKRLKQIDDDLTAIGSASTSAEAAQQILARNGGAGTLKSSDIITVAPSGLQRGSTVQTSGELVSGTSRTTTTATSRTAGIGTVTDKRETTTAEVKGDHKTTTSDSRTTKIGIDLAPSTEKTTKKEHEKDGKTTGVEQKTSTAASVSEGTVTHSSSTTVTRSDGSSTATTTSGGLERADGKLGANVTRARTATDADGKETKTSGTGKAGLVAGKDGMGGFGDVELGRDQKTPGGMKTGTVFGASANIVCNVVKDETCDPPMYELTLTVDFGVRIGKSSAHDKEPEKGKPDDETRMTRKVSVGASQKVVMERKNRLDENGARAYVDALKTGNGTQMEFGIIRCGLKNGWPAARDMYLGLTRDVTSQGVADRLEKGGSLKVGGEQKVNLSGEAGTKGGTIGVGASVGAEHGHDGSVTVSKDQDGNVTYDAKQGDSNKLTGGAKVSAGAVEGSFSMGHEWKTSKGYKIAIPKDASKADADAMRKALAACKSQADLDAFAKRYPKAVQESTQMTGHADTQEVSVSAGKVAKVGMKFGSGVDEETTKDAEGKVKQKKTTGTSEGGMDVTVLGHKIGDSSKQTATSTTDTQGRSRTDVTQDDASTDMTKFLASMPGSGEGGALSKATGGADTDRKTSTGLGLDDATLKRLGLMAVEDWNGWMHAPVNADDRKDWATAGRHIQKANGATATVAKELANFVGGDSRQRMQVIEDTVRGSRGTGGGDAWEFGGELAKLKADYDRVVIATSEETVTEVAKDPAKAKEVADKLLATLETLHRAVEREPNFKSPARRAEMLAAIDKRRAKVRLALKQANAAGPVTAPSADEQKQRYNELLANCRNYQQDEKKLFQQVQDTLESVLGGDTAAANGKLVAELQALYKVWDAEYEEMATLAQTYGWGENIYWHYRPDRERYKLAHDNKKPYGDQKKNESEREKAKRYESTLTKDEKNRKPDPNAKSDEQLRAERKQQDDDRVKRGTAIQNELPGASRATNDRGMLLYKCIGRQEKYDAVEAFNAGKKLWDEGEVLRKQVHKDHMPELVDMGAKALAKYKAADAHFDKGLALYPKDWRK